MKKHYMSKMAGLVLVLFFVGLTSAYSADITTTSQGGLWGDKTTWVGGALPAATDNVIITSVVTTGDSFYNSTTYKMVNLTINPGGKIIREKEKAGLYVLEVSGNLINNGEIIDYKDYFDINLSGNLENNGVFKPRLVYLKGENQHISTTKPIECQTFNLNMTDGELIATSNLIFTNCDVTSNISTTTKKLNMGAFSLSLSSDSIIFGYGSVGASQIRIPVIFEGTGTIVLDNSIISGTVTGNIVLKSPTYAFISTMIVDGNLTITEGSKVSSIQNLIKLTVKGNFINYGFLNNDTVRVGSVKISPRSMYLYVNGNTTNLGSTGISTVYPITNGKTISLEGNYDANVYIKQSEGTDKPGGKVVISTEVNIAGTLTVYAELEIAPGASLNLLSKAYGPITVSSTDGKVVNNGNMYRYHYMNNSWGYRTFSKQVGTDIDFELRSWDGRIEGVDITVHKGQTYPNLPGSTKQWWHIESVGEGQVKTYTAKFYYDEAMLNGQSEENLKVYQSIDKGETWNVVSHGEYSKLDTIENSILVGNLSYPESMLSDFGDFVISSGDGSVPVESSILVDIIGSPNVRIGAPNRFTIHVYNVTDYRTSPVMLALAVSEEIRFKEVRLPYDGGVEVLPVDSISDPDDLTQVFYIPYLAPNEHYSFDVIVYGNPDGLKSASEDLVTLTLGGFFGHVAKDEAGDFIVEKIGEAVDLDKAEKEEYARGLGLTVNQLKTEKQQYGKTVTTIRHLTKYTVKNIAETNPVTKLIFSVGETVEAVYKIKDSLRRRLFHWFYKEVGLYGVEEKVASGKQVSGKLVVACDPNEKIGPSGYGESNFISKAGNMNYTILFENKKEATAPAYRIQVVDTLSEAFDPETVKFESTSHSGPNYNWKTERNGNILKWDIEGIELPPNVTPPEGEGFVSFSVNLKKGLLSGTEIANRATIIFDMNPPIATNTWINVLDTIAPKTIMNPIKYANGDSVINISCSSTDDVNGSGSGQFNYFVSVNNAPFGLIGESFENTIQYQVSKTDKNSYRFYALATDNVGNAELKVPGIVELKSIPVSSQLIENPTDQLKIYPNPTAGIITIEFYTETQSPVDFQIYSVTGELLKSESKGLFEAGKHHFTIDVSDLIQGVYFAKVTMNSKLITHKIVLNK